MVTFNFQTTPEKTSHLVWNWKLVQTLLTKCLLLSISPSSDVNMPSSIKYLGVREQKLSQLLTSKCLIYTGASCLHGMVARPWGRSVLVLTPLSESKQHCWHLEHAERKPTTGDTKKFRSMLVVNKNPSVEAVYFLNLLGFSRLTAELVLFLDKKVVYKRKFSGFGPFVF